MDEPGQLFPWFVAVASLALALLLFFRSTVPALTERRGLDAAERRMRHDVERLRGATELQQRRRRALPDHPEALLVEFDRHGLLPPRPDGTAR